MTTSSEVKYRLTLSEDQLRIVREALDLYVRIGLGQFKEVAYVYDYGCARDVADMDKLREALEGASRTQGFGAGGSYGIHSQHIHDVFRQAYDIKQVVRNRMAWERSPSGGYGVDFDTPRQIGALPLPLIETLK